MTKYFKLRRDSELGKQFVALIEKGEIASAKIEKLREKYGFEDNFHGADDAFGGIVEVVFPEGTEVDMKLWKRGNAGYNSYAPRRTGAGKAIAEEFASVGKVSRYDFDQLVQYRQVFSHIGLTYDHPEYVGIMVNSAHIKDISADCVELTGTEYEQIFNKE